MTIKRQRKSVIRRELKRRAKASWDKLKNLLYVMMSFVLGWVFSDLYDWLFG